MTLPTPKHYWNFNEGSGTTAVDSIGGAMMTIDRANWRSGRYGTGLRFNPADGAFVVTTTLTENLPPPWTVAAWVYREADTKSATLLCSRDGALKLEQWEDTHAAGVSRFGEKDHAFEYKAPVGQWVHLTFVGTASDIKLYADGKLQGTLPGSIHLGMQWIGSTHGEDEFASMILDDLEIFEEALNEAQAMELYDMSARKLDPRIEVYVDGQPATSGGFTDLGVIGNGQPRSLEISIKNRGSRSLTYSIQGSDTSGAFMLPSVANAMIEPEVTHPSTYPVTIQSIKAGPLEATLTLTSNDPAAASFTHTIYAWVESALAPQIEVFLNNEAAVHGTIYDLGSFPLGGSRSVDAELMIKNSGKEPLTYSIAGDDRFKLFQVPEASSTIVAGGAPDIYHIQFAVAASGEWSVPIKITSNDPTAPSMDFWLRATVSSALPSSAP